MADAIPAPVGGGGGLSIGVGSMITPKSMSKRVFGIGIIISGLLVLSIALILGLRFPAYVYDKAVQTQCILESDHNQYEIWVSNQF